MSVRIHNRTVTSNAKRRFALGDSKNIRSIQYCRIHKDMDAGIARYIHNFPLPADKPHKSTAPATIQPAPVRERYNGLRRASNSFSAFHQRSAAISRTAPHADRLNTSHRSRVTLRGRFRDMDSPFRIKDESWVQLYKKTGTRVTYMLTCVAVATFPCVFVYLLVARPPSYGAR